jgi:hypothetical protein
MLPFVLFLCLGNVSEGILFWKKGNEARGTRRKADEWNFSSKGPLSMELADEGRDNVKQNYNDERPKKHLQEPSVGCLGHLLACLFGRRRRGTHAAFLQKLTGSIKAADPGLMMPAADSAKCHVCLSRRAEEICPSLRGCPPNMIDISYTTPSAARESEIAGGVIVL